MNQFLQKKKKENTGKAGAKRKTRLLIQRADQFNR